MKQTDLLKRNELKKKNACFSLSANIDALNELCKDNTTYMYECTYTQTFRRNFIIMVFIESG